MQSASRGFTLVELVVVIIILGILSAFAAPKFINVQGSARGAALKGLGAAVTSAATLANALQQAQGLSGGASITVEGAAVTMINSYPTANAAGIGALLRYDTNVFTSSGSTPVTFQVTAATTPASCSFTYAAAASSTLPATVSTPTTTGC